jgi:hypothetical protein
MKQPTDVCRLDEADAAARGGGRGATTEEGATNVMGLVREKISTKEADRCGRTSWLNVTG